MTSQTTSRASRTSGSNVSVAAPRMSTSARSTLNERTVMKLKIALVIAAAALIVTAGLAAAATSATSVGVSQSKFGRILVDGHGRSLYLFDRDRNRKSSCYGGCAGEWPPLIVSGKPHATSGIKAALLGRTKRRDGRWQVTFRGHPHYTFAG